MQQSGGPALLSFNNAWFLVAFYIGLGITTVTNEWLPALLPAFVRQGSNVTVQQ